MDEVEKSKVNEAVHAFLLVLCTSHKFGVIFKDPALGLGRRQNNLMFTVLESLERPWEHSYPGELVIKICRACPDLAKTVWSSVKTFLEPRWTEKWLKTINFAHKLVDELEPDCIDFAVDNLTVHQVRFYFMFMFIFHVQILAHSRHYDPNVAVINSENADPRKSPL